MGPILKRKPDIAALPFIVFRYVYDSGTGPLNQFHDPLIRTVTPLYMTSTFEVVEISSTENSAFPFPR